ncbi:MAG TPA: MATE family efflux transporter [Thermoanaerobaculia bacterium]
MRAEGFRDELRRMIRLATPLAVAAAGTNLMGLVDVAVLGRLSARDLAASGLANAIFFSFSVFGMGMVMGVEPLIAQAIGAGDRVRARHVLWQGIWLALATAGALTTCLLIAALLLPHIGSQPELIRPATVYLLIRVLSIVPFLLYFVMRAYLQAQHITRPLLFSMVAANVFNLGADILLVFGGGVLPPWAGVFRRIPAMGVAGAALATVACTILQFVWVGMAAFRVEVHGRVDHRWNRPEIERAFRVGLPLGLQTGAEVAIFALVGVLASRLGTLELAAHQLAISLASLTFCVALGVSSAGTVRVGRAIGARDVAATRSAGYAAFLLGASVMGISALSFALFPRSIARLVTDQEDVIATALPLMLVTAVFQISDGIQAVGAGVLRGAGDTKRTFYVNILGHWCIGLPVALFLGFRRQLGVVGLWWGLCAGLTVVAVLLFLRFERLSRNAIAPIT